MQAEEELIMPEQVPKEQETQRERWMERLESPNERRRRYTQSVTSRSRVVVARQVLSTAEADRVLQALQRAAAKRKWSSDRHAAFPTMDLPAYALSARAYAWVERTVRSRIVERFAKLNHLDAADLYLKDLFFVLYDAELEGGQRELALHQDGSLFSFNILLNDASEFEGGGTVFPQLGTVNIDRGDAVMHDGKVLHGGAAVKSGRRIILVGFVETLYSEVPSFGESQHSQKMRKALELQALTSRSKNREYLQQEEMLEDALLILARQQNSSFHNHEFDEEENDPVASSQIDIQATTLYYLS